MVSLSYMVEGFELELEDVMEALLGERYVVCWGMVGESRGTHSNNYLSSESWSRSSLWVEYWVDP